MVRDSTRAKTAKNKSTPAAQPKRKGKTGPQTSETEPMQVKDGAGMTEKEKRMLAALKKKEAEAKAALEEERKLGACIIPLCRNR